jgi:hypothetical protein
VAVAHAREPGAGAGRSPLRVDRSRSLPGGRAVVGALLVALAAIGVFTAYTEAARGPTASFVVAATDLPPGHVLEPSDLSTVTGDLPSEQARQAFAEPAPLVGRVLLGPVARSEILQTASVTEAVPEQAGHEIALLLPRGHVAASHLRPGDRVDLLATTSESTVPVVHDALLVGAGSTGGGAIGEEREVSVVVSVPELDDVVLVVHALRTADLTVVRSTHATASGPAVRSGRPSGGPGLAAPDTGG